MIIASFGASAGVAAAAVRIAPRCSTPNSGNRGADRTIGTQAVADVASPSASSPAPRKPKKSSEKMHSLPAEKLEIVKSMDDWLCENVEKKILKSVEESWQPQDFLPDPESPDFLDQVSELRKRTKDIPDAVLVTLVGDMVTEEALPTYQTMLNTLDGTRDDTGAADTSWARWIRAWTAEENRHGDLLNKYLWCTGRVNMTAVERTIQHLIGTGMDPKTENNPYMGYIYTSFQERATKISHGHTGKVAREYGDMQLSKICGLIASDEGRHEVAYQKIISRLLELDPDYTVMAYADMMRKQIVMPAHLMYDGENPNIWNDFSSIAEDLGVYTAMDYAEIIEHLNKRWDIEHVKVVDGEAAKAQEYLMKLPARIRKLAERASQRRKKIELEPVKISWISNREVMRRP